MDLKRIRLWLLVLLSRMFHSLAKLVRWGRASKWLQQVGRSSFAELRSLPSPQITDVKIFEVETPVAEENIVLYGSLYMAREKDRVGFPVVIIRTPYGRKSIGTEW